MLWRGVYILRNRSVDSETTQVGATARPLPSTYANAHTYTHMHSYVSLQPPHHCQNIFLVSIL